MTTPQMKEMVKAAYPGASWKSKVNSMKDAQIIALYYTLIRQGKIIGS